MTCYDLCYHITYIVYYNVLYSTGEGKRSGPEQTTSLENWRTPIETGERRKRQVWKPALKP